MKFPVTTTRTSSWFIHEFEAPLCGTRSGSVLMTVALAPDDEGPAVFITCHHHEGANSGGLEVWREWCRIADENAQDVAYTHNQLYDMETAADMAAITKQINELIEQFKNR